MQRRSARGTTTASRIKTLVLYIDAEHSSAASDAFCKIARVDRQYLQDETRAIPLLLWHQVLKLFAKQFGRDAILATAPHVCSPDNIAVWTGVLRTAHTLQAAIRRLEFLDGNEGHDEQWFTDDMRAGRWQGRVVVRERQCLEGDGLCALSRASELAALPTLFGLTTGNVKLINSQVDSDGQKTTHWLELDWSSGIIPHPIWSSALGFSAGGLLSAAWALLSPQGMPDFGGMVIGGASGSGALVSLAWNQERARKQKSRAQLRRIQVLERGALLHDIRQRLGTGFSEGSLLAGAYRLRKTLGAGASGTIWEAECLESGRLVAIKLLKTATAHDSLAADRLRREAAALNLAWHPNVVEALDDGQLPDGTIYLVMERLFGESLAERLRRVGSLNPTATLQIARQLCDALEAVHAAGVIHRDVKPANIFLATTDGLCPAPRALAGNAASRVKLLDFGVARVEWAETRLTNRDVRPGTPGYMSPEQEFGREVDARTDIFSLACVLYECLTGSLPEATSQAVVVTEERERKNTIWETSSPPPPGWEHLLQRALAPIRSDRFVDARSFKEALLALGAENAREKSA